MKVVKIDPLADPRWDAFVEGHDSGSLFHLSEWARVLHQAFGYSPRYFAIVDHRDQIASAIPTSLIQSLLTGNRLVSLPFVDYCDPLVNDPSEFSILVEHILQSAAEEKINSVVFKCSQSIDLFDASSMSLKDRHKNHRLSLTSPKNDHADCSLQEIFKKLHRGQVQRNIKKAQASELKVVEAESISQLKAFSELMLLTRKKHGLPPHPFRFFASIWDNLRKSNRVSVLIAQKKSVPVAGIMLVWYKDVMYYLYGGSNPNMLKERPNHLLLWMGIEKAHADQMQYFDFGRTSLDNRGLIDFKRRWGTVESDIHYYDNCSRSEPSRMMKLKSNLPSVVQEVVRRTPAALLKFGSNIVYKHLGS